MFLSYQEHFQNNYFFLRHPGEHNANRDCVNKHVTEFLTYADLLSAKPEGTWWASKLVSSDAIEEAFAFREISRVECGNAQTSQQQSLHQESRLL